MEKIRVLIVDDVPQVREGLATVLKLAARASRPGIEIVGEAPNGYEASQQAQSLQPDVILIDLEMAGMDGYEATRRIKAEQPALRVIILSIHADTEARQRARAAGADGFVTKGAGYEVLVDAILGRNDSTHLSGIKEGDEP